MPNDLYESAVCALAQVLHVGSRPYLDGKMRLEHFQENDQEIVPDMLERLGVMTNLGMYCEFENGWHPGRPLNIARHEDEPSLQDLYDGLDFVLAWYATELASEPAHEKVKMSATKIRDEIGQYYPEFVWSGEGRNVHFVLDGYKKRNGKRLGYAIGTRYRPNDD